MAASLPYSFSTAEAALGRSNDATLIRRATADQIRVYSVHAVDAARKGTLTRVRGLARLRGQTTVTGRSHPGDIVRVTRVGVG